MSYKIQLIKSLKIPKWLSYNRINTVAMPTALAITLLIQYSCDGRNLIQQKSVWNHLDEEGDTYFKTHFDHLHSLPHRLFSCTHAFTCSKTCVFQWSGQFHLYMTQGTRDISYQPLTKPLGFLLLTMGFRHRFYSVCELVIMAWTFASESCLKTSPP